MRKYAICLFCLISASSFGASVTIINPSNSTLSYFGEGNAVATIGQTFVTPDSQFRILDSVALNLLPINSDPVDFAFYVYKWNETRITGDCLYASSKISAAYPSYFTFNPDIKLDAGINYIWFISASGFFDGLQGRAIMQTSSGANSYPGGRIAWMDNKNDFSQLSRSSWWVAPQDLSYVQDLAFEMVFTPEPSTLLLLGLGGLILRKRRK